MASHNETKPKRRRKFKISYVIIALALAVIICFIIFRLNSKSKLESKFAAIRAAGYPVTCVELDAWYTIPEFSENAADTIIEAFSYYYEWDQKYLNELPAVGKAKLPARTEPMAEETRTLVADYLTDNKKALELLHKAAAIEHCRYPIDFTLGFSTLMPYLSDIRQGARTLHLEAIMHTENGEPQLAIDSVKAIFGIARSLEKEPLLISQLVRIGCQALGVSTIERLINRAELTDKQLMEIEQILVNTKNSDGMIRAFAGERCMTSSVLQDSSSQEISSFGNSSLSMPAIGLYRVVGLADIDSLLYIDIMTKNMDVMALAPHHRREAAKAVEAEINKIPKIHILLHILMPAFSRCIEIDLRCTAAVEAARTAVAIERYRLAVSRLPNTLADLVPTYLDTIPKDPFDGEDLRYKTLDTGFVVYSIGEDETDDGGKERLPKNKRTSEPYTSDITFIVER